MNWSIAAGAGTVAALLSFQARSEPFPPKLEPNPAARVELALDKAAFFLGENVVLHYCVVNLSTNPMRIDTGGDYRGAMRSLRFKVAVTDEQGMMMPDPHPSTGSLGGLVFFPEVKPSVPWCQSLPLMKYVRIDRAGTYRVRVVHDLGWPAGTAPVGEVMVRFTMPTLAEAGSVVSVMTSLPASPDHRIDERTRPWADFTTLGYAVYLDPLLELAQTGHRPAVAGIGAIPTPEATSALVALIGHANRDVGRDAARQLAMRLPDPALDGKLAPRGAFVSDLGAERRYLIRESWRPEFAPAVRRAAGTLLASPDPQDVVSGAFMIEAAGTVDDGPVLADALTQGLERTLTLPFEKGIYPRPRGAMQELMRAAEILVARGYRTAGMRSPGETALWVVAFAGGARSDDWLDGMRRALAHPIPYVRELALKRLADPVPAALADQIRTAVLASEVDLQIAACELVHRARLTNLRPAVAAALANAREEWLLRSAVNTLIAFDARFEAAGILADRLTTAEVGAEALKTLLRLVFESTNGGYMPDPTAAEREALSIRWRAFIAARRVDIEQGRRISFEDAGVTSDLVPPGWSLSRSGKPNWPK